MDIAEVFNALVDAQKAESLAKTDIIGLGELIARLENMPGEQPIRVEFDGRLCNPGDVDSYRGYYSDLYIDYEGAEERTTGDFLQNLREAVGETFTGYKGGDYTMSRSTPVWVDYYGGASGIGVTGVEVRGVVTVITSAECDS